MNSSSLEKKEKTKSASNNAASQNGSLSNQQRTYFKGEAHHLKPAVIIGQDGLTPSVLKEIDLHLNLNELIKIRVLGDQRMLREQFAQSLVRDLNAALVQHIGKTLILYRRKKEKVIESTANLFSKKPGKKSRPYMIPGGAREVKVRKVTRGTRRNPLKIHTILGNQRITQGGLVKRVKKQRQASAKKQALGD